MSIILEFFIAPDDAAATSALAEGPEALFPTVSDYGNFDPTEAMVDWESLFTGRREEDLLDEDVARMVAHRSPDGICAIFAFSPVLQNSLATADSHELDDLSRRWVQSDDADSLGSHFDVEQARTLLADMAELARTANASQHTVYCWMC